tara:strand:- start:44 stop:325 length:282 start_codon:yes stop_codon:yes gene_type:complete
MHKIVNGQRVELTAEEISQRESEEAEWNAGAFDRAMVNLRSERNRRLAQTDWIGLRDVTWSDDWGTYRQALRDLPAGLTSTAEVEAVNWPTSP